MLYALSPTSFAAGRDVPSSKTQVVISFLSGGGVFPSQSQWGGCVLVAFGDSATEWVVFKRHGLTVIALSVSKRRKSSPQRQEQSYIKVVAITELRILPKACYYFTIFVMLVQIYCTIPQYIVS